MFLETTPRRVYSRSFKHSPLYATTHSKAADNLVSMGTHAILKIVFFISLSVISLHFYFFICYITYKCT